LNFITILMTTVGGLIEKTFGQIIYRQCYLSATYIVCWGLIEANPENIINQECLSDDALYDDMSEVLL
jgi:hypothetical protein